MSNDGESLRRGLQWFEQARQLRAGGDMAAAAGAFAKARALMPDHPTMLAEYGTLAEAQQDFLTAETLWRRLGELRPASNFEGRLGISLFSLERFDDAIPFLRTHLGRHPDDAGVALTLVQALVKTYQWESALPPIRELVATRRNAVTVELLLNCLYNLGMQQEFDTWTEIALTEFPDNPLILALCGFHLLKNHEFQRGFGYQPAIRRRYFAHKPDMRQPAAGGWDGKRFDGLLLIDAEQGLGEEILAASMFTDLQDTGQRAVISCDPRLLPLFRRSFPALEFVSRYDDELERLEQSGIRHYRFYELDLACIFRRRPFVNDRPWLQADGERIRQLQVQYNERYPHLRRKAISWRTVREVAGSPRSIRLVELAPLFRLPDMAWFNVQYGDYSRDIAELAAAGLPVPWDDLGIDQTNDLDGLAAQLFAFGSLVSISNTTVHLAGALGVKSHLLLPRSRPVMWYWGYTGTSTPWYPSITIHRNTREQDWSELAVALAAELAQPGAGNAP